MYVFNANKQKEEHRTITFFEMFRYCIGYNLF